MNVKTINENDRYWVKCRRYPSLSDALLAIKVFGIQDEPVGWIEHDGSKFPEYTYRSMPANEIWPNEDLITDPGVRWCPDCNKWFDLDSILISDASSKIRPKHVWWTYCPDCKHVLLITLHEIPWIVRNYIKQGQTNAGIVV